MLTAIEEPGEEGPIDKTDDLVNFVGTYQSVLVPVDDGNYYISSDLIYYVDAAATVPTGRFRGYFHTDVEGLARRMGVKIDDEIETAVVDIDKPQAMPGAIYSIDGKMVRSRGTSASDLRSLPKGIYITNGRRIVVQ